MKQFRGFDDATGMKIVGFGTWFNAYDPDLRKKLRALYEEVKFETGMDFPDLADYDDPNKHSHSFAAWYKYLVTELKGEPGIDNFRLCSWVTDGTLFIGADDTCGGFEDDWDWDQETIDRWENEYN